MSKKKKFTQEEMNIAVREARRSGQREGRLMQKQSIERHKQFKKFHDECENIFNESIEVITQMVRRSRVQWTHGDIIKRAAIRSIWKTRVRLGETP
jgi:hypothetical protein